MAVLVAVNITITSTPASSRARHHVNLKAINRSEYLRKENEFSRSNRSDCAE